MAAGGLRPFCAIYSTFLQRAFDQVLHDVALQGLPVRFFLDRAGLVGDDGPTHHGAFDLSYLSLIPGMTILAPRDTTELRQMAEWMRTFDAGPTAMRYPRGAGDDRLPESRTPVSLGKAEVLAEGREGTLLAIGSMVAPAWEARTLLAAQGLDFGVVNARFMAPLDEGLLGSLAGLVVTLEENVARGGFGEAVRAALHRLANPVRCETIALPDGYVEHGTQAILRSQVGLNAASIAARVAAWVGSEAYARKAASQSGVERTSSFLTRMLPP
jgi:1-deoxy-D-xylulose-5-phosphate synthase